MINVLNVDAIKSTSLSSLRLEDFGLVSDVKKLPVDTAYREVGWYRRALDLRMNGVAMCPFDVRRGDDVVFDETTYATIGASDRLAAVNIFPLLPQLILDMDKHGSAYAILDTDVFGYKRVWRRLHPASMIPRYNMRTGELTHFERYTRGTREEPNKQRFELDEVLWLWMPSDNSENKPGSGVGYTALLAATVLANKDKFGAYFFERGAINPTIVSVKGLSTSSPDVQKKTMGLLQRLMGGIRNAFKIIPLDAEVDVKTLMQNLKDMSLDSLTTQQREEIATTLGIPHSILFSNAANFATAGQDDINFYDKTILPLCHIVLAPQLNEQLFSKAGMSVQWVKSRLEVFQKQESEKAYALATLYDRGFLDANVILEQLGLETLPQPMFKDMSQAEERRGKDDELDRAASRLAAEEEQARNENKSNPPSKSPPASQWETLKAADVEEENVHYPALEDIDKWERLAIKRLGEGKPEKMLTFESDVIEPVLKGWIAGSLDGVYDVADVRLIFDDARGYAGHGAE